ncbi:MAG TPA: hypothetical protein ENL34_09515 [Chloroflexi bacterium]|nr:hypothetical protein [Chloroflexota bacterium]
MHKGKRILGVGLAVTGLLVGCCCLWLFQPPPLRYYLINRLDRVKGKAELVIPAQRSPRSVYLSPGGHWMLLKYPHYEWRLWDLVGGAERELNIKLLDRFDDIGHARWLEEDTFIIANWSRSRYFLVHAPDLTVTEIKRLPEEQIDGVREVELLKQADRVYAVDGMGFGGYTFVALDEAFQYVIIPPLYNQGLALRAELPHAVEVPTTWRDVGEKVYSPDQAFYAVLKLSVWDIYLEIHSAEDDKLVAEARKRGYHLYLLGWAHDGSGVYFKTLIHGVDAAVLYPESPVYKLSVTGR